MDGERAARLRGLLVRRLITMTRAADEHFTLLHLFLLPPAPGETRFLLYEVIEPVDPSIPVRQVVEAVREELAATGDPRLVSGGDTRWQRVDPGLRGHYAGTGARFTPPNSDSAGTTILRMADGTAVVVTLDADGEPAVLQTSQPVVLGEAVYPAIRHMPVTEELPFVLVDTCARLLWEAGETPPRFRPFG
ncbi:hypothetical protein [Amycolatopsis sacchari]|uniref:hypothetical protein n=1 Tax=Amycolatopsis sacchari TaxID=115433 RepID=UPI003EBC2FEC